MAGVSNQTVEHDAKTRGIILHIVEQIKSQGVFDRFRRDCLEELDSKEPYRQLKQRVESHVATFLSKQMFSANLPKNQLRTSLRANINQSEVLSKGVDRLLEQVLVEKSIPFYKEIENLVEEHLISTGHYTRYDRDKPQKSERDGQSRSEHAKLSDKEVEDIIKEETYKLLEATADGGKSQGSDKNSLADSPPPGTSGEVIEVETLISSNDDASTKNCQTNTNVGLIEKSEAADLNSVNAEEEPNVEMAVSGEPEVKVKTENSEQAQESKVAVFQVVIESKQCLVDEATSKEMDARLPVPGDSTSTCSSNEDYQVSRPEVITESNPVKSSAMLDVSLNDESEAMDVEVEPSTLEQNTLEDGKLNENLGMIPEMERSKGYPPAVENSQAAAAALVEEASIEQQDVSKESKTEVDLRVLNPGVKLGETKAEVELKRNIPTETAVNPETEIKKDDIHEAKVDNLEIYTPEETKSGIHKPEVLQTKVLQAKVVMPEVAKPKVDKAQEPEEKAKQTAAEEKSKLTSKQSVKPATKETLTIPNIFSTDEETDEDIGVIEESIITRSKPVESKPDLSALEIAELSDSDITVSSVHTSDLSSLEDSMSDMEYEDYQELALKKNKQKNTGESSAGTSKDIDTEDRKFDKSSAHTSRILHSKEESEEEECGESGAGTSQKISNQEESEEKSGESCAVGEKEVDSIKEQHEEKCEESGAGTNEDIDSKEKRNIESVDSSTDWSVLLHESSLSRSQATTPQRLETHDNPLPVSMDDDNQISHNFSQETTPSFMQFSAPAFSKNIENLVPEVEPISSYDSEPAQTTDAISDADNGIALEDAEVGNPKLGQRKHRRRISTEQENESSNDIQTPSEEQREPHPQRRSARVASKDRLKSDEKDDNFHGYNKEQEKGKEGGDSSRRLRRRHSSQDKGHDLRGSRSKEERRKERAEKRAARLTSDSNDSDVKTSKRSKRQVRPTRCYSPSENS